MARLPSQKLAPLKELRCYHATETSCRRIARSKLGNNHHHLALKKNVPQQFEMGNFEGHQEVQRKKMGIQIKINFGTKITKKLLDGVNRDFFSEFFVWSIWYENLRRSF